MNGFLRAGRQSRQAGSPVGKSNLILRTGKAKYQRERERKAWNRVEESGRTQ